MVFSERDRKIWEGKEESATIKLVKEIYGVGVLLKRYKKEIEFYISVPNEQQRGRGFYEYIAGGGAYSYEGGDVRHKSGLEEIRKEIQKVISAIKKSECYDNEAIKESEIILENLIKAKDKLGKTYLVLKDELKIFETTKKIRKILASIQKILEIIEEKLSLYEKEDKKIKFVLFKFCKKFKKEGYGYPSYQESNLGYMAKQEPEYIQTKSKSLAEIRAMLKNVLEPINNAIQMLSEIYSSLVNLLKIEEQIKNIEQA